MHGNMAEGEKEFKYTIKAIARLRTEKELIRYNCEVHVKLCKTLNTNCERMRKILMKGQNNFQTSLILRFTYYHVKNQ